MKNLRINLTLVSLLVTVLFTACSNADDVIADPTPTPPLTSNAETPIKTYINSDDITFFGANWQTQFEYKAILFKPTKSGKITHLGALLHDAGDIRLILKDASDFKTLGALSLNYTPTFQKVDYFKLNSSVAVSKNKTYIVMVGSKSFRKYKADSPGSSNIFPKQIGNINLLAQSDLFGTNEMPNFNTGISKKEIHGAVDFRFIPSLAITTISP